MHQSQAIHYNSLLSPKQYCPMTQLKFYYCLDFAEIISNHQYYAFLCSIGNIRKGKQ